MYEKAAQIRGGHVPKSLYFAAKAWSRADDNERGLALYDKLIKTFPRSPWAERASYYAPRLHRLQAQWSQAADGYGKYLKRYPRGTFANEVAYELALCQLLSGQHGKARARFEALARKADTALDASSYRYLAAGGCTPSQQDQRRHYDLACDGQVPSFVVVCAGIRGTTPVCGTGGSAPDRAPPPSMAATPLNVRLPVTVRLLRDVGLDRDAERLLMTMEEPISKAYGERGWRGALRGLPAVAYRCPPSPHWPAPRTCALGHDGARQRQPLGVGLPIPQTLCWHGRAP